MSGYYDDPYMDEPIQDEERKSRIAAWWSGVDMGRLPSKAGFVMARMDPYGNTSIVGTFTCWPEMQYCSARANGFNCTQHGWFHHEDHDPGDEQ
jgi:hypothetical protein